MVYKKYVLKKGKRHGPYYYHSYRENDKVKKIYIGGKREYRVWKKKREQDKKSISKAYSRTTKNVGTNAKQIRATFKPFSPDTRKILKFVFLIGILLVIIGFFILNFQITGKASLDIQDSYISGENLSGSLRFGLKQGELLPIDSKLIITQDELIDEYLIGMFIEPNSKGNFYVKNTNLIGEGEGYGFPGEKITYPDVFFELKISDFEGDDEEEEEKVVGVIGGEVSEGINEEETEGIQETIKESEEVIETPDSQEVQDEDEETEEGIKEETEEIVTEDVIEFPVEEETEVSDSLGEETNDNSGSNAETNAESTEGSSGDSSESSGSGSSGGSESIGGSESDGGSLITGEAVKENKNIKHISGNCSKGNDFVYELEYGKTAEIKKGSVKIKEADEKGKLKDKKIDESLINLQISGSDIREVRVSTDYSIVENGFGEEYLSDEENYLDIDLDALGIKAEKGRLTVSLIYGNEVLIEVSKEIDVKDAEEPEEVEEEIEFIENITLPDENITLIEENITVINETLMNISGINLTISNRSLLNITTRQYKAIIGRPVKWIKEISVENVSEDISLELPKQAKNITIKTGEEINQVLEEMLEYEEIINNTDRTSLITGQVTGDVTLEIKRKKGILTRAWEWMIKISITGNVIQEHEIEGKITETEDNKLINLTGMASQSDEQLVVEYYTDGPTAIEENINNGKKIIVSDSNELNYTEILAYTRLDNRISINNTDKIKIYWNQEVDLEDIGREEDVEITDTDIVNESIGEQELIEGDKQEEITVSNNTNLNEDVVTNDSVLYEETAETGEIIDEINKINETNNETIVESVKDVGAGENAQNIEDAGNISVKEMIISPITGQVISEIEINQNQSSKIQENIKIIVKELINFTAYDLDKDGFIDYVEWSVPHLSNQTYEIIYITKAEHLDENRTFISDIYEHVKEKDDNWSEVINNGEYVRVTFEIPLDNTKDITIYARVNDSVVINGTEVPYEVYQKKKRIDEIRGLFGE